MKMEKSKSTHGGTGRGQGRKPLPVKQKSYSFRCYPSQMEGIRKLIKEYKEKNSKVAELVDAVKLK